MKEIKENTLFSILEVAKILDFSEDKGIERIKYYIDRGNLKSIVIEETEIITGRALLSFLYALEDKQEEERMNKQLLDDLNQD